MSTATTSAVLDWQAWHREREQALRAPHGWLQPDRFPLAAGGTLGAAYAPGVFGVDDGQAVLTAGPEDGYLVIGVGGRPEPVDGTVRARVQEAKSLEWLKRGDVVVELALRGGRYAIRTRDPMAPSRVAFTGVPTFEFDQKWVLEATFEPFPAPRTFTVGTARQNLTQQVSGVGTVTVSLGGRQHRLTATAGQAGSLNIAFHDESNGTATAGWRSVPATAPDEHGRVRVDFNRAVNFPYAFTDYGTCPRPPAGNHLPLAVTAGELAPAGVAS